MSKPLRGAIQEDPTLPEARLAVGGLRWCADARRKRPCLAAAGSRREVAFVALDVAERGLPAC